MDHPMTRPQGIVFDELMQPMERDFETQFVFTPLHELIDSGASGKTDVLHSIPDQRSSYPPQSHDLVSRVSLAGAEEDLFFRVIGAQSLLPSCVGDWAQASRVVEYLRDLSSTARDLAVARGIDVSPYRYDLPSADQVLLNEAQIVEQDTSTSGLMPDLGIPPIVEKFIVKIGTIVGFIDIALLIKDLAKMLGGEIKALGKALKAGNIDTAMAILVDVLKNLCVKGGGPLAKRASEFLAKFIAKLSLWAVPFVGWALFAIEVLAVLLGQVTRGGGGGTGGRPDAGTPGYHGGKDPLLPR